MVGGGRVRGMSRPDVDTTHVRNDIICLMMYCFSFETGCVLRKGSFITYRMPEYEGTRSIFQLDAKGCKVCACKGA